MIVPPLRTCEPCRKRIKAANQARYQSGAKGRAAAERYRKSEKGRAASQRYRSTEKARATGLRNWHTKYADPEKRKRIRENANMARRLRAEREGHPIPPLSEAEYFSLYGNGSGGHGNAITLPAAPLRRLVKQWLPSFTERCSEATMNGDGSSSIKGLARLSGVSDRRIRSVLNGHQKRVSLRLADCVCTAIGIPLALVYREEEP